MHAQELMILLSHEVLESCRLQWYQWQRLPETRPQN